MISPRHRAKSTAIPRRTHLTRRGATIAVPSADRRYFSANKRIQHERRTQHGCGTSRVRGKVASCRGRGSRQQRPRQGQGTFDPSPAARAECERAFQDGAGQERPAEVTVSLGSRRSRRLPGGLFSITPDLVSHAPVIFARLVVIVFPHVSFNRRRPLRHRVTAALSPSFLRYVAASHHQERMSA